MEDLLARHLHDLHRFISARMGPEHRNHEESMDLLQSVCRHLVENQESFVYEGDAAFRRWLRATTRNVIVDRHRRHLGAERDVRRLRPLDGDVPVPDATTPSVVAVSREERERIQSALERLDAPSRQVIVLTRLAGLSNREVAARMNRTEGAARMLLFRALARLSLLLEPDDSDER